MNPILIIKGTDVCYNILNFMAEQLGQALEELGKEVVFCDTENGELNSITQYLGKSFEAIIGFQSGVFNIFIPSKQCYLFDMIHGPKFNFYFDHPIIGKEQFEKVPQDYYVFTHDRNYISFIQNYFKQVRNAFLLPPGGNLPDFSKTKDTGLIFMGTYNKYRNAFGVIKKIKRRHLACCFLNELKKNYNNTAETVLSEVLRRENMLVSDKEYLDILQEFEPIVWCVFSYFREKVIGTLLRNDISVTVYGESWKESPFVNDRHLTIKEAITPIDSIGEYSRAKLSLNVMAWHKDGFTERIVNSMLSHAVVVSDKTRCLEEQYVNDEEIILFDLSEVNRLSCRIKELLDNDVEREAIADRAYKRAIIEDTWMERAKLFIEYCNDLGAQKATKLLDEYMDLTS